MVGSAALRRQGSQLILHRVTADSLSTLWWAATPYLLNHSLPSHWVIVVVVVIAAVVDTLRATTINGR